MFKGFEKMPEMPSDEERLEISKSKLDKLNKELERFNLPENLPDGKDFLPDHLSEEEKNEIIIIQEEKKALEIEIEYLEDKEENKKK